MTVMLSQRKRLMHVVNSAKVQLALQPVEQCARLKVNDPLPNMPRASDVGSPEPRTEVVMRYLGESAVDRQSGGGHTVVNTPISSSKAILKPRGLKRALTRLSG